ncbi:restriction endonuclease subunit S [Helcococcus massiliensis]|uniref:restriction endonuclease subunit S n=1 Tax=Helcococcus massiliensis TaxID=2040290 RepID=UPI0013564504|nr:restriction endonuclease subunit S [Helcococcus massiliensis]
MSYKTGWVEVELSQLGKIITGKTPKTYIKENFGGETLFLTPSDNLDVRYITETSRKLTDLGVESLKNKVIPKNSICISCIGSKLGKVIITTKNTVTNQQINSIIPNEKINYMFLYYYMIIIGNKLNYLSKASTAIPIINKSFFSKQKILLPPLNTQIKIAKILSSIDDKIENNNKIISNLESQAQAIFKSWFVDFEPFKDSKFKESELGMIPERWEISTLDKISKNIITGKTPSTKKIENYGDYIPFITIPDMHNKTYIVKTERYLSELGSNTQPKKILPKNSIITSCIATVGLISLVSEYSHTNQQINGIISKESISPYYIYSFLKTQYRFLNNIGSSGSTTKNINKTTFANIKILIPDENIMNKYHKLMEPIFEYILRIEKQNNKLSELRDTLLPKLMSGEINLEED